MSEESVVAPATPPRGPALTPSDGDREIEILIAVCTALEPLNDGERRRVLKYLWARLVRDVRHKPSGITPSSTDGEGEKK